MTNFRRELEWLYSQGIISAEQTRAIDAALTQRYEEQPHFSLGHVIYYFGALLVISAMSWFMVEGWETLGGGGILTVALFYGALFYFAGAHLAKKPGLRVPSGLLYTAGVWMTPLAVYGLQRWMGWWPKSAPGTYPNFYVWVKEGWFFMELVTVVVGMVTVYHVRFPFLMFPVAFVLWFMSMDITPMLFGQSESDINHAREIVSLVFGLVILGITYLIDRRTREDFAFWGYLCGMLAFWGGLTFMDSDSEINKFIYCLINVFLVFLSVFLSRKVFIVFGTVGVFAYLGHLAYKVFVDSLLFPVVLSGIGLTVIFLGIKYQKHRTAIESWVIASLPAGLRRMRPTER